MDDGAANHLLGLRLPDIALPSTHGDLIRLSALAGRVVLYFYPMTGRPDCPLPEGWDSIPGARGCTPQACGLRDHFAELLALHVQIYGISTQSSEYQQEAKRRLHLPFELLSDTRLQWHQTLNLPMFQVDGFSLYKRLTLVCKQGCIEKVFYPVFPPDKHIEVLLAWLGQQD